MGEKEGKFSEEDKSFVLNTSQRQNILMMIYFCNAMNVEFELNVSIFCVFRFRHSSSRTGGFYSATPQ